MGKKVCLEFSIPYYMDTAKCHDFFPAHSRHIQGSVGGSFSVEQACF